MSYLHGNLTHILSTTNILCKQTDIVDSFFRGARTVSRKRNILLYQHYMVHYIDLPLDTATVCRGKGRHRCTRVGLRPSSSAQRT